MRERTPERGGAGPRDTCGKNGAQAKHPLLCRSAELVEFRPEAPRLGQQIELCGAWAVCARRLYKGLPEDNGEGRSRTCGAPSTRLASTLPRGCHQSPFLEASPLSPPTPHVSWSHSALVSLSPLSGLFGLR